MLLQQIKTYIKQYTSILMLKSGFITMQLNGNGGRIVLLMYHRVTHERDALGLSISPVFFEQQLKFLKSRFKMISLTEVVSMLASGTLSGEYACLTFDDGYRDNYDHAYQLLRKYNVPATIFVTVDSLETGNFGWHTFDKAILGSECETIDLTEFALGIIDLRTSDKKKQAICHFHHVLKKCAHEKREAVVRKVITELAADANFDRIMLTWHEAKEMQASGLVTIGAHTLTHPILTRVNHARACFEITKSKTIIEEKLGSPVEFFAYPNGREEDFDDGIVCMLKNAGYLAACTTIPGSIMGVQNLYRLPRIAVNYSMCEGTRGRFSSEMFEVAVTGPFSLER